MQKFKPTLFCLLKPKDSFIRVYNGVCTEFIFEDINCTASERIRMKWSVFVSGLTTKRTKFFIPWWEIVYIRR